MTFMIEARDLTKRYGPVRAIDRVSFTVSKGEVVGFLGPNGAGKTTTMKILTCFIAPTEGSAKVNGADIFEDNLAVRRSIGYLPESTPLYQEMQVLEYLEFVARMRGLKGEDARNSLKKAVDQTGLGDRLGQPIRELSKGFKQRVGLAQALVHSPPVLILDEPMSGLDPNQASEIRELITSIGKERTVILSTHNLAEVRMSCSRVLIISRGRIVADDKPDALTAGAAKARFQVEVKKNGKSKDDVKALFAKVKGISTVEVAEEPGELVLTLVATTDDDLRADLFQAAVDGKVTLLGLSREKQNLEAVFRDLTTGPADEKAYEDDEEDDGEDEDEESDSDERADTKAEEKKADKAAGDEKSAEKKED